MKRKCISFALLCVAFVTVFTSCGPKDQRFAGYKKTADGLYYQFYNQNKANALPNKTDFVKMSVLCYLKDSLFYGWEESQGVVHMQVSEPRFKGDLQSAIAMMREGDSASFYIKADSIASVYYAQDPVAVGLTADDYFRYEIKMMEVQTAEEFQAEIDALKAEMQQESKEALAAYIAENNIDVTPTASGIYVIPIENGKGRCPVKGEKVEVEYDVYLLDGTLVGSSSKQEGSFSFVLGEGHAIPGWEEVVPMMHQGDKVRAIIPYEMAYNEHDMGNVKPYSNLVYDINLLGITTAEELARQAEQQLKDQKLKSEKAFVQYLKDNEIVKHTESGLYYKFEKENEGNVPVLGSTARVKFNARILGGDELGSSDKLGEYYDIEYGKGTVLRGLEEGIGLMAIGDKAQFVLPYSLAYGEIAYGTIPAYSNLIFDVELLDILAPEAADQSHVEKANAEFDNYLKDNKIKGEKQECGLVYVCNKKGSGACPVAGQTVTVHYTGKLMDGRVFDSSVERGEPISFVLGQGKVIQGWEKGIALMKKGEKSTLIIPFNLAYGNRRTGSIPPYSNLVFDVEIIDIK